MPRVIYNNKNAIFFKELKVDIDKYFSEKKISKTGNWRLYLKSFVLIAAALALYISLLIFNYPWWLGLLMCGALGFTSACIGFNVMHDALHGSYSQNKWLNENLGAVTMNVLGGNAFLWKQKHNIIHHTYTNIDNVDDDIAKSPMIRMCNTQNWFPIQQIQHLYIPVLYMLSSLFWVCLKDYNTYFSKEVSGNTLTKMKFRDHFIFWFSKVLYLLLYVAVPCYFVGFLPWLLGFLTMHFVMGFTLSIVFQLAHVVEETDFEYAQKGNQIVTHIDSEWAIHQINTTTNFSPKSRILGWCVGGLNFQIEHHLFPKISHIHYPAISKIVEKKCSEFNIEYNSIPTFFQAINSHFRFLKQLGKRPVSVAIA